MKYQRLIASDCKDLGIRKPEFVAKTEFLYNILQIASNLDLRHSLFNSNYANKLFLFTTVNLNKKELYWKLDLAEMVF